MAIVGIIASPRLPELLSSAQSSLPFPASCHSFLSRGVVYAPCASKGRRESENCVALSNPSRPSLDCPTRGSSPFPWRRWHRVASAQTLAVVEEPGTVLGKESGFEISREKKRLNNSPFQGVRDANTFRFHPRMLAAIAGVTSSLVVTFPAGAEILFTDEEWVQFWIAWVVIAFMYLLVIPLLLYNYLRLRWYKRKLPEAILQFGLVFLFFPGLLLLAPFINFRRLPRNNAKDPWDDPRSLM